MTHKISNLKFKISNYQGFTLIELLVVISIIGVLVGLSIFGLSGARVSARDAKRKADLEQIRSGIEIFKSDCNRYPATLPTQLIGVPAYSSSCLAANIYITAVPSDVISTRSYYYVPSGTGATYSLCAALEQAPSPAMSGGCVGTANCGSSGNCNYIVINP